MTEEILGFLQENVVEYKEKVDLSRMLTVKIGGTANVVAYPDSFHKLTSILTYVKDHSISYRVVGRMSNILPRDSGYSGIIVKTDALQGITFSDNFVKVDAGIALGKLARLCARRGLAGLEPLCGIPGSLGGAIVGNAGAYGREIGELVRQAEILDLRTNRIYLSDADRLGFGYRNSKLKNRDLIILSAKLKLCYDDPSRIFSRMKEFSQKRQTSQPIDYPSLGSVFKRPEKDVLPWKLIDGSGLRGYRAGDAQISEKHAGFIVNLGRATSSDFLSVAETVEDTVRAKYNVVLEREFEML
jgi:UDP-N-acetylmuramate dehydrogenase